MPCAARTWVSLMPPAPRMPMRTRFDGRCVSGRLGPSLLRGPDLDLAVPDLVAVILQEDVPLLRLAEAGDVLELALGDGLAQRRRVELVLEDLLAVQPVLDVAAVGAD